MAEANREDTPIPQPDAKSGWTMLAKAFIWVTQVTGHPEVAANEIWRALLDGRVRSARERLDGTAEFGELTRTFWRRFTFSVGRDERGREALRVRQRDSSHRRNTEAHQQELKQKSDLADSRCYVWQADIDKVWSAKPRDDTAREAGPHKVKTGKRFHQRARIDAAARRLYENGEPPPNMTDVALPFELTRLASLERWHIKAANVGAFGQ